MASPRNQIVTIVAAFVVLLGTGVSGWFFSIFDGSPEPSEIVQEDPRLYLYSIVVDLAEVVAQVDLTSPETVENVRQSFLAAISGFESLEYSDSDELVRRFDDLLITGFELSRDLVEMIASPGATADETAGAIEDVERIVDVLEESLVSGSSPDTEPPSFLEQPTSRDIAGAALIVLGIVVTIAVPLAVRRGLHKFATDAAAAVPVTKPTAPTPHPERADTDGLSGAVGRSSFERSIVGEVARAKRYDHPLTVVSFLIDALDDVYEQMGAATGDYVLTTVGEAVSRNVRVSDLFARLGENTFVLVLPETDIGGGRKVAEKLRRNVEIYPFDEVSRVTLSLGATAVAKEDDPTSLVARAEAASRQAAQSGGNTVIAVQRSVSES